MQYKIIETTTLESLVRAVNDHIAMGWQPLGGVAADTRGTGYTRLYQAMMIDHHS